MNGLFSIGETQAADQLRIEHLLDLSFGIDRRTKTSYRLREGSHAVADLSLVARDAAFLLPREKEGPAAERREDEGTGYKQLASDPLTFPSFAWAPSSPKGEGNSDRCADASGLAGSIAFWPLVIGEAGTPALLLGPLAVHPERQNRGVGLALMREGLARAKAMGHALVILVGDEPYYARVGFRKLPRDLLIMPGPNNPDRFLYLELVPGALAGMSGLVLPPHRFHQHSAAFAVPHGAEAEEQGAEA